MLLDVRLYAKYMHVQKVWWKIVDAQTVLNRKSHVHGKCTFDVAEYYEDLGVCGPNSLNVYEGIDNSPSGLYRYMCSCANWKCHIKASSIAVRLKLYS